MKLHLPRILLIFVALVVVACGGGEPEPQGPPEVAEATFARGLSEQMEPINPGNEFQPDETVYLAVKLKGNPKEGVVSARFFYQDQEITRASLDLAQMREEEGLLVVLGGNTLIGFTLSHDEPFPAGDEYRAELFVDDEPVGSYSFEVAGPAGASELPTEAVEPEPTQPPDAATDGAVSSLQDVKSATVQIEAAGSFVHPEFGQVQNVAGAGSGFIIDPSGIAVTNNHVVTGAALLRVYVGGETEPRNAKILGVSECSDLAVIDIEGEGFPYLEWYEGDLSVGLPIYAAGFPLGDPEYTLLQGIISKERANGETNWASVDSVIEHSALTNPGNSGGPVVTEDGKVVAVHYAGNADTEQHFAIARAEALPVIERLRAGEDENSIGVNGEAVNNGEDLSGIWVSSVESGSPADKAGVKGGDIITELESLVLATDYTKSDYCDILRTHQPEDVLDMKVVRFSTQEVLEGQLNGRPLEQAFSFAEQVDAGDETSGSTPAYAEYAFVQDNSGALTMEVPVAWSDLNGNPWEIEEQVVGGAIVAAADLDAFYSTWTEPGVFFGASSMLLDVIAPEDLLDFEDHDFSDECQYEGRKEYVDAAYKGLYDHYSNCGGEGSTLINLAAVPEDQAYVIWLQVQVVDEGDLDALDRILNSFQVVGELPTE
jgi:serine protease Do